MTSTIRNIKNLVIGNYNTRTINEMNEENFEIMVAELYKLKAWHVIGLCETMIRETLVQENDQGTYCSRRAIVETSKCHLPSCTQGYQSLNH